MEESQNNKKWLIVLALLLLLLLVSSTALGIALICRYREPHPTVTVPLNTTPGQTQAPAPTTEETEQTAAATEPTTAQTLRETTAETTVQTVKPTAPPPKPTSPPKATEPQVEATLISLHNRQEGDNVAFYAMNMLPGDAVTRYYCVRVAHSEAITLHYRADIRQGYGKLAQVLRCRISVGNTQLYDGLMRDMPDSLDHRLGGSSRSHDTVYQITVYLDTSVGNDYQNRRLVADFNWWVEDTSCLTSPQTGDTSGIGLWSVLALVSLLALLALLVLLYRRNRRLARLLGVFMLLALLLSTLCVTAFAATRLGVSVNNNRFRTGTVKINLNDGNAVTGDEMFSRFEPGMTAESPFFIENQSTDPVYYKLYFSNVSGSLADVLEVSVTTTDGRVLYDGKLSALTRIGVGPAVERLELNEKKELLIWFHFPEAAGNASQQQSLSFVLCADAVQTSNNPNGDFE